MTPPPSSPENVWMPLCPVIDSDDSDSESQLIIDEDAVQVPSQPSSLPSPSPSSASVVEPSVSSLLNIPSTSAYNPLPPVINTSIVSLASTSNQDLQAICTQAFAGGNNSLDVACASSSREKVSPSCSPPRKLMRLQPTFEKNYVNSIPKTPIFRSPEKNCKLERFPPEMVAFEVPKVFDWQQCLLKSTRNAMVNLLATELIPEDIPNAIFTQGAIEMEKYAQTVEEIVFKSSDSHTTYRKTILEKISSWQLKSHSSSRPRQALSKSVKITLPPRLPLSKEPSLSLSVLPTPEEFRGLPQDIVTPDLHTPQEAPSHPSFSHPPAPEFLRLTHPWQQTVPEPKRSDGPSFPLPDQNFVKVTFMPIWQQINNKPESVSLRKQISNSNLLQKSVTLLTIKRDLESNRYTDPWAFIEDVWLMLNNIFLVKEKSTKIYQDCTTIANLFKEIIEPKMVAIGFCCGTLRQFDPKPLSCGGNNGCSIAIGETYFHYENMVAFCEKCFTPLPKRVDIEAYLEGDDDSDDGAEPNFVAKSAFCHTKNEERKLEPFVRCWTCERKLHRSCVNYLEVPPPKEFVCNRCLRMDNKSPNSKPRAKDLPTTYLSISIEDKVNRYLTDEEVTITIRIRVVASCKGEVPVLARMLARYPELPESFPCVTKTLLAFIEDKDDDICFFGLHVQEYGSECPEPNTGRVYIACLDSVHYLTPKEHKTPVYHQIILGYLDHCKTLGYSVAHIWICPAKEGASDFIFYSHPSEQKMPGIKRLQNWYKNLLKEGIDDGIVMEFKTLDKYATEIKMSLPTHMPYFQGDFWPETLERLCQDVNGNGEKEKKIPQRKKGKKKGKKTTSGDELWDKVVDEMQTLKNIFIVARLNAANTNVQQDPDGFITCGFLESRDQFVNTCALNQWEFSSLRRVKFSTLSVIHEIKQTIQAVCDICHAEVFTWFTCETCKEGEFDLCGKCKGGHKHPLKKMENGTVVD